MYTVDVSVPKVGDKGDTEYWRRWVVGTLVIVRVTSLPASQVCELV